MIENSQTSLIPDLKIKTSQKSTRKYPNVIWFPRSKTDPREIREVLKLAKEVQNSNPEKYFNDKLLGEYMAKKGSINVVGLQGEEYIKSYEGKSTGDKSYITNARMLMRFFRFLGYVSRIELAKYVITPVGNLLLNFEGTFPDIRNRESEEQILLRSLSDFAFYSVNDRSHYRDGKFKIRPFVWLLNNLAIEPQCIYQLIITTFSSRAESEKEIERIKNILENLRDDKTTLKKEFAKIGLDADDYSCVHNSYDSAKILVYLGMSLGLIEKTKNAKYGKKISGNAKHLKQASIFYKVTEKGRRYLSEVIQKRLIYYEDIYKYSGEKSVLEASYILATLNTKIGNASITGVEKIHFQELFGDKWYKHLKILTNKLEIEIIEENRYLVLNEDISFNFWQSIPPEFLYKTNFLNWYEKFMESFYSKKCTHRVKKVEAREEFTDEVTSRFVLDEKEKLFYKIPDLDLEEAEHYISYKDKSDVYGGQDRFPARVSPTDSILLVGDQVHVDNERDALDLIAPLRFPDENLKPFIERNIFKLMTYFSSKTDQWQKDEHYTWVRNCFRLFGCEAIYSGSSGMLSRADISITEPFIGGIEAKSPSENRGSINTKAIRQAVDAKIQVADKYPDKRRYSRAAIAIGRRITPRAIEEQQKWEAERQPILLITDLILYYLTLNTIRFDFHKTFLIHTFCKQSGELDKNKVTQMLDLLMSKYNLNEGEKRVIFEEIDWVYKKQEDL